MSDVVKERLALGLDGVPCPTRGDVGAVSECVATIKKLSHLLAVYVHAHETGNSVPPHIDTQARDAIKETK